MRPFRRSLIVLTSLALLPVAGVASAGQARPRSAPPAQGSSSSGSGSSQGSSSSSSSSQQGRSGTQAQRREAPPPPQVSQPQAQTPREQGRETARQNNDDRRNNNANDNSRNDNNSDRRAIPAPRDRYIDLNRDGRNDNRDSTILGPQDRRDLERRYNDRDRYDGRYERYDSRYSNYSYRYNGPRIVFAPREPMRFNRPWFSFRTLVRLPFGLTLGVATPFPSWYRPYIVGRSGYVSPYMPYGGVTFDIEPRDAELWIDGEYIGRASDYSYYDPPLTLVAGLHEVELRSRYSRPLVFEITVIAGQVIPYQGTLPYYR
ncbi:MAG: hypothetical protein EPO35_10675 [Acidobacteria bacterium]|nr:MAG: hypothetical protein EPO35_10675 [Acidobacteriota bacterium]